MNYITIKFPNNNKTIKFDKLYLSKYPHSVITCHCEIFPELDDMELDTAYDDFKIIYNVVIGKLKQWQVSEYILQLASKYGLVDDELCGIKNLLNDKINNTCLQINNFLNSRNVLFVPDCIAEYLEYKKIFAAKKNIIPFQVVLLDDEICCINIYAGLPIYFSHCTRTGNALAHHDIFLDKTTIDINFVRNKMFLSGYNTETDTSDVIEFECISKIYDNNEIVFLGDLLKLFTLISGYYPTENIVFKNTSIPKHNFDIVINNNICDRIKNVIIDRTKIFEISENNLESQKFLFNYASFAESAYYPGTTDYHFYAYCGFINITF
uniref:Uncharacterized protein n=1 Tax=viral metagenome TaxID=1070528 RepID=A0A6C0CBT5_9ZZZZ